MERYNLVLRIGINRRAKESIISLAEKLGAKTISKKGLSYIDFDFSHINIKERVFSFAKNLGVQIQNRLDRFDISPDIFLKIEKSLKSMGLEIYHADIWSSDGNNGLEYFLKNGSSQVDPEFVRKNLRKILSGTSVEVYE